MGRASSVPKPGVTGSSCVVPPYWISEGRIDPPSPPSPPRGVENGPGKPLRTPLFGGLLFSRAGCSAFGGVTTLFDDFGPPHPPPPPHPSPGSPHRNHHTPTPPPPYRSRRPPPTNSMGSTEVHSPQAPARRNSIAGARHAASQCFFAGPLSEPRIRNPSSRRQRSANGGLDADTHRTKAFRRRFSRRLAFQLQGTRMETRVGHGAKPLISPPGDYQWG